MAKDPLIDLITASDDIRAVESVAHLVALLERRYPIFGVKFTHMRRVEELPGHGAQGWQATIAFSFKETGPALWSVRDTIVQETNVRLSPYAAVSGVDGRRRITTEVTLHAQDFPSLWLMERIRRS